MRPTTRSAGDERSTALGLASLALISLLAAPGPAAGVDLVSPTGPAVPVQDVPVDVLLGDVDLDGDLDLVAPCEFLGASVRLNAGDGSFADSGPEVASPSSVRSGALGDLDGDGDPDLVLGTALDVRVHQNVGGGVFDPVGVPALVVDDADSVALADLDGDGALDLIATDRAPGVCRVRLGDGAGGFATTGEEVPVGDRPNDIALGDLDGDGDLDLVVGRGGWSTTDGSIVVRHRDSGAFAAAGPEIPVVARPMDLSLADTDGDGDLDLAFVIADGASAGARVHAGDGAGSFAAVGLELPGVGPTISLALDDLDGDGDLDLAVADLFGSACRIFRGDGAGGFGSAVQTVPISAMSTLVPSLDFVYAVRLGDLDGNGVPDLAATFVSGFFPDVVAIRLDVALELVRGDANTDGSLDIGDPVLALGHLFGGESLPCDDAADANDDGALDIADPIALLAHLFSGGPALPAPAACALDPTSDPLGCAEFAACP